MLPVPKARIERRRWRVRECSRPKEDSSSIATSPAERPLISSQTAFQIAFENVQQGSEYLLCDFVAGASSTEKHEFDRISLRGTYPLAFPFPDPCWWHKLAARPLFSHSCRQSSRRSH